MQWFAWNQLHEGVSLNPKVLGVRGTCMKRDPKPQANRALASSELKEEQRCCFDHACRLRCFQNSNPEETATQTACRQFITRPA